MIPWRRHSQSQKGGRPIHKTTGIITKNGFFWNSLCDSQGGGIGWAKADFGLTGVSSEHFPPFSSSPIAGYLKNLTTFQLNHFNLHLRRRRECFASKCYQQYYTLIQWLELNQQFSWEPNFSFKISSNIIFHIPTKLQHLTKLSTSTSGPTL